MYLFAEELHIDDKKIRDFHIKNEKIRTLEVDWSGNNVSKICIGGYSKRYSYITNMRIGEQLVILTDLYNYVLKSSPKGFEMFPKDNPISIFGISYLNDYTRDIEEHMKRFFEKVVESS